ncbi:hypothetical protein ACOMHN_003312 [Nucella lapillus]
MSTKSEVSNSASGRGGHYTMPLYRKLLLSAMLTGNDAAVSFEQLYQVPLLQVLGVPITYVSFTAIVSGPLAMMLMNVLGYLSDKGQHHRQKKVAMVVFNSFLILTGLVILIWANVLMVYGKATGMNDTVVRDNLLTEVFHENNPSVNLSFNPENLSFTENAGNLRLRENPTTKLLRECRKEDEFNFLSMPTTALLGLLAFCLLDTGYDLNTAATRTCVLACSSRQEHTPLLVMALVMAGAGGCITTLLGTVDTSAILNWGDRCVFLASVVLVSSSQSSLLQWCWSPPASLPCFSGVGLLQPVFLASVVLVSSSQSSLLQWCWSPPASLPCFSGVGLLQDRGEGERSQVGRAIAVVTCMIPLNYATLFFISGPLITLTNEDSAPLLLASASAFLAMLIFLLYKS